MASTPARVAAPHAPERTHAPERDVVSDAERHTRSVARARMGLIATSVVIRIAALAALALAAYWVVSSGIIPQFTDSFATWYAGTIAPTTAFDIVPAGDSMGVQYGLTTGVPPALRPAG